MSNEGASAHGNKSAGNGERGPRNSESYMNNVPTIGDVVALEKLSIKEGFSSAVKPGYVIEGKLVKNLTLGEPVLWGENNSTSRVIGMNFEGGSIIIVTETSTYRISKI